MASTQPWNNIWQAAARGGKRLGKGEAASQYNRCEAAFFASSSKAHISMLKEYKQWVGNYQGAGSTTPKLSNISHKVLRNQTFSDTMYEA